MTSCTKIGIPSVSLTQTLCVNKPLGRTETPLGWPRHRRCLGFNWWEDICYILLKKISSPNAFYVFLPLFKHQTSAYNVLFLQKKYAFLFSFKTGTGSPWEGPHNNNKATCPCCLQSRFTTHSFVVIILYIYAINVIKLLQYILFFLFHKEISLFK